MMNIMQINPFLAFHFLSIMSNHGQYPSWSLHRSQKVLYTDPILFYKACLQQYQLKMGSMNRYYGTKKRIIKKRPIYPLTMTLIPQARWRVVNNPVMPGSGIVVAKALYHRVLKK